MSENFKQETIENDAQDMRLNRWIQMRFPMVSFGDIQKFLRKKLITVNKKKISADYRLAQGDIIRYPLFIVSDVFPKENSNISRQDIDFIKSITLYEDTDILVLNKPHGLAAQGGSGTDYHLDGLLQNLPRQNNYRPVLVHRLDRDTSGCILVAKKRTVAAKLGTMLQKKKIQKNYWAICSGQVDQYEGMVKTYLVKQQENHEEKVRVVPKNTPNAQSALTVYKQIERIGPLSFISFSPLTGRTHQLRVHSHYLNVPIVGDPKYTSTHPEGFSYKLHLHARSIAFNHPKTEKPMHIIAPLSPHMEKSFDKLGIQIRKDFDSLAWLQSYILER